MGNPMGHHIEDHMGNHIKDHMYQYVWYHIWIKDEKYTDLILLRSAQASSVTLAVLLLALILGPGSL